MPRATRLKEFRIGNRNLHRAELRLLLPQQRNSWMKAVCDARFMPDHRGL